MKKLTKNEFGLSSKHELWNRIKELEDKLQSHELTYLCVSRDYDLLKQELTDANATIDCFMQEIEKLKRHNDYLLTLLSSNFKINKKISFHG